MIHPSTLDSQLDLKQNQEKRSCTYSKNGNYLANMYLFKVNIRCKTRSKLTKTHQNDVIEIMLKFFIGNFEDISNLFLVFLLLNFNK